MTAPFTPYGQLSDGSMGFPLDTSNNPTAVAVEILSTLPDVGSSQNYVGRTVFSIADVNVYVFNSGAWVPLKTGQVTIGSSAPSGSAPAGTLYYSTTTEILYIYVGGYWVGIAGKLGTGVIWRHYTGDGVTALYDTGSSQMPPTEYVQVFVDGIALQPGSSGVRDYYTIGNGVQLNAIPATNDKISIRTLLFTNPTANSSFLARRYVADGTANAFDTGTQMIKIGQVIVTIDGVVQVVDTSAGAGTYDYKISTQNNTISSMTASGTTVTVTTAAAHGYTTSENITIVGANQSQYNGTFAIASVPTSTTFTFTAGSSPSASPATGTLRFGPVKQNDKIVFYDASGNAAAPESGAVIYLQTVSNLNASY